ncbi:amidohydrolase family protein [Parahaliea mediterranea]|uniref:amidohydrolase family protein n=1 Tax=Parahaliea mediterranea TaxID=651086 RepID=UPI000E2F4FC4|nr:amidohydrolase family protein [Parahaliea mediterranea]
MQRRYVTQLMALGLMLSSAAAMAQSARWELFQNSGVVGHVSAQRQGSTIDIDYYVDQNGRGPKHHEQVVLDGQGLPVSWQVEGTSLMGGEVSESFIYADGVARWQSQADSGERRVASPLPYIVNDSSPWSSVFFVDYLLSVAGGHSDVLPEGRVQLKRFEPVQVQHQGKPLSLTPYQVIGAQLDPGFVFLDASQQAVAMVDDGSIALLEAYRDIHDGVKAAADAVAAAQLTALQRQLAHRYDVPVDIENVRVFDPLTGHTGAPSTVRIVGNRIAGIRPYEPAAVSEGAARVVVAGEGGVLLPGLHDMHSHSTGRSGLYYLAAGVTSTRDMGNDNAQLAALMAQIGAGEIAGPRITRAGFIEGESPYAAQNGILARSEAEALAAVDWYADRGFFQIKLYNSINPDWVQAVAARAHQRGLRVTGHIPAFGSPDRSIRDGYDEIAHINQLMLGWLLQEGEDTRTPLRLTAMQRAAELDLASPPVTATLGLMQDNGVAMDTTAVILERLMMSRAGTVIEADRDFIGHMPIGYQRYRKRTYVPLASAEQDARYGQAFQRILDCLHLLYDAGITLLPGTDDTTGFTLQRELELYTRAGIPAAEVLAMATLNAARHLGTDGEVGSVEVGKLADLVLLADDPTDDIKAIKRPRLVIRGGSLYLPAEIYTELGIRPFASAPVIERRGGR